MFWTFSMPLGHDAPMDAKVFCHTHRVTYADCTVGNHIYYARYLELLEAARGEFFRGLGTSFLVWQDQDTIFPVIEARLCYKLPARYDEVLRIELWMTTAGPVRLNFAYRIKNQDSALVLEGETAHACTGLEGKPKRQPAEVCSALLPFYTPVESSKESNM